jgi:hypothetical protein
MTKKGTIVLLVAAFLLTFVVVGCSKPGVSKEGFDKVEKGMTLAQVEKILGTEKKGGEASGALGKLAGSGATYVWEDGDKKITVVFKDGKVETKAAVGLDAPKKE